MRYPLRPPRVMSCAASRASGVKGSGTGAGAAWERGVTTISTRHRPRNNSIC